MLPMRLVSFDAATSRSYGRPEGIVTSGKLKRLVDAMESVQGG